LSDRFYFQQLKATGSAPGFKGKRRKRLSNWDDEKRAAVIEAYEAAEPTPETSMDIVAEIAEEHGQSVNGVRMVLSKAGVYVKKTSAKKSSSSTGNRVSKAAAHKALTDAITDTGQEADAEIISKLTGKAAQYLAEVLTNANSE
jgi:bifunctional DNase/RNase